MLRMGNARGAQDAVIGSCMRKSRNLGKSVIQVCQTLSWIPSGSTTEAASFQQLSASSRVASRPLHRSGRRLQRSSGRGASRLASGRPAAQPGLQLRQPAQQAQRGHPQLHGRDICRHHHAGQQPRVVLQPRLGKGSGALAGGGDKRVDWAAKGQVDGPAGGAGGGALWR